MSQTFADILPNEFDRAWFDWCGDRAVGIRVRDAVLMLDKNKCDNSYHIHDALEEEECVHLPNCDSWDWQPRKPREIELWVLGDLFREEKPIRATEPWKKVRFREVVE